MQVTKSIFVWGFITGVIASCAHQSSTSGAGADWPKENPFKAAKDISVASQISAQKLASTKAFRLGFSGNVNGELDPCGCAVNPKGGLDRRLNFVRKLNEDKNSNPLLLVDAGNALFPSEKIHSSALEHQKSKARLILKGNQMMGVAV